MRALFLNHNVVGTGTYGRAASLARELACAGHEVTLVTTSRHTRWRTLRHTVEGVRVLQMPDLWSGAARTGWDPWNTLQRSWQLRAESFDLVHAFDCRPAVIVPALLHRRRTGQPLFLDWADWWGRGGTIVERSSWPVRTFFGPIETWFEEAFRPGATANTTISEPLRQRCIALGVPAERVLMLAHGCDAPHPDPPARMAARRRLGVAIDAPLVLHVGVMQPADAAFLFDAVRLLRAQRADVRVTLVGNHAHGIPADLAAVVHGTGYVGGDVLRYWLAAADIGVVPMRDTIASRGRFPSKVNAYLSAGLPTVMPDVGGAAEAIRKAAAGRVCAATPAAFAATIAEVLEDSTLRQRMAANSTALATGPLAWSTIAPLLLRFYDESRGARAAQTSYSPHLATGSA